MKLISELRIRGFRSIRDAHLKDLGDFTAFAGLNNSGKSNVLRALNAFFHDETDPGTPLDIDSDYYRPDLSTKKAKRISIAVTFSLPSGFRFRRGLESAEAFLGGRSFQIRKEWRRNRPLPDYYAHNQTPLDLPDRQKVDQFLQLINFRYIPNRVLPIDVIRGEHQSLKDTLIRRLGKRLKGSEKTFEAIRETSEAMVQALAKRVADASPDAGQVRLATPVSWGDVAFAFGYRLQQAGVEIEDAGQGSGIQSLLMLETLYLIDRDYFQKFGWRQAAIWAVEEPESSLHSSLEARIAAYLAAIASEETGRLQVLCTTHSDLMLQYASKPVLVQRTGGRTTFDVSVDRRTALDRLSRAGVSRWAHPILHFPTDPLVLVEGKVDHRFLKEAFRFLRPRRPVRVTYLELLDDADGRTGGDRDLLRYVKANGSAIKARPRDSPVVVVLDWDAAGRQPSFAKLFSSDDPFKVLAWPESSLNPMLGKSFHGVERCYSDRLLRLAESKGVTVGRTKAGVCSIEPTEYGKAKQVLAEIVVQELQPDDLAHARPFLDEILKAAEAL